MVLCEIERIKAFPVDDMPSDPRRMFKKTTGFLSSPIHDEEWMSHSFLNRSN